MQGAVEKKLGQKVDGCGDFVENETKIVDVLKRRSKSKSHVFG